MSKIIRNKSENSFDHIIEEAENVLLDANIGVTPSNIN